MCLGAGVKYPKLQKLRSNQCYGVLPCNFKIMGWHVALKKMVPDSL